MTYKPFVKVPKPNLTQAGCTRQNRPGRDALIDLGHGSLILFRQTRPMFPDQRVGILLSLRCEKRQTTRRDRRGIERQRTFPIGITRTPAPSSSGGFPTRVLRAPARTVALGPASENLHRGRSRMR